MDRRDLLKYFGIGSTITPVLNGAPLIEAAAELISVPNVKPGLVDSFPDGHQPSPLWFDRLQWNPYELIWLKFWQIQNNPPWSINGGVGTLHHLLGRTPTQAEKSAAAAVLQWFGTNCGHCFVTETLEACGYRLGWSSESAGNREIKAIQRAGVWPGSPAVAPFAVERYGRKIILRAPERAL